MFNLGLLELVVLGAIALIVIGPKQLPDLAMNIARFLNELKRSTAEFRKNFTDFDEVSKAAKEVTSVVRDTEHWVKNKAQEIMEKEVSEKLPLEVGHRDNPNHDQLNNTEKDREAQPEACHEGFAQKNKKENS